MSETASSQTTPSEITASATPSLAARLTAELIGTLLLVFGIVGTAIFAAGFTNDANEPGVVNVGFLGVAFAAGITVIAGAYAFGPISGGHFNPAVTLGLAAAGRFAWKDVPGYIVAQFVGGLIASTLVYLIAIGQPGFEAGTFASNGYGELSPGGYGLASVALLEVVVTALFVLIIIGSTSSRAPKGFGGLAIGLALALFHLIAIPVSNASLNPARSLAPAVYGGVDALAQVWAFFVFPILGALIAGYGARYLWGRAAE